MNVYSVTLTCDRSFGNGHKIRETETPQLIIAKDGDEAVAKAKKSVALFNPSLEGLECLVTGAK
jgi:hypothetical protein